MSRLTSRSSWSDVSVGNFSSKYTNELASTIHLLLRVVSNNNTSLAKQIFVRLHSMVCDDIKVDTEQGVNQRIVTSLNQFMIKQKTGAPTNAEKEAKKAVINACTLTASMDKE